MKSRLILNIASAVLGQFLLLLILGLLALGVAFIYVPNIFLYLSYFLSAICGLLVGYGSMRLRIQNVISIIVSFISIPIGWLLVSIFMGVIMGLLTSGQTYVYDADLEKYNIPMINELMMSIVRFFITLGVGYGFLFIFSRLTKT